VEEEEMDRDFGGNSDLEGRSSLVEVGHKACLESLDLGGSHLVVDHSRDHIEDNNFGTVVAVVVVESLRVGMEAGCEDGLVVTVDLGEMHSMQMGVSKKCH
jgi:hypothetical protein